MNKIVRKEQFSEKVFLFEIEAPLIAKSRKAGNFVIVRVDKKGERMPLTIAGADIEKGTITKLPALRLLAISRLRAPSVMTSRCILRLRAAGSRFLQYLISTPIRPTA